MARDATKRAETHTAVDIFAPTTQIYLRWNVILSLLKFSWSVLSSVVLFGVGAHLPNVSECMMTVLSSLQRQFQQTSQFSRQFFPQNPEKKN